MNIVKKIKTKKDYSTALARFEKIFLAKSGTKEGDEAELFAIILKDYEDRHFVRNLHEKLNIPLASLVK